MPVRKTFPAALAVAAALIITGCGSSGQTTSTTSRSISSTSTRGAGTPSRVGPGGASPTGHAISAPATRKLAKSLGVSTTELTSALKKARSSGAGVNLVHTLASELNVSQTKVAAGLKALGSQGP